MTPTARLALIASVSDQDHDDALRLRAKIAAVSPLSEINFPNASSV